MDVNQAVRAGDVLLRISNVEQEAGANLARAQLRAAEAQAVEAEQNYRRFSALADTQYVSKAQLDQARAAATPRWLRNAAAAAVAQASQQAAYTVLRAPYDGVSRRWVVEPGETVAPGMPLMACMPRARCASRWRCRRAAVMPSAATRRQLCCWRMAGGSRPKAWWCSPPPIRSTTSVNVRVNLPTLDRTRRPARPPRSCSPPMLKAGRQQCVHPFRQRGPAR